MGAVRISGCPRDGEAGIGVAGGPTPDSLPRLLPMPTGRYRAQVTGMDFAPDLKSAAVLTYGDVLWYRQRPGKTGVPALARPPRVLGAHGLPQAEAICFSRDGRSLIVTGEGAGARIVRFTVPRLPGD